jgi:hypothetical protein
MRITATRIMKMGMAGIPALMGIDISGSLKIGIPLAGAGIPR